MVRTYRRSLGGSLFVDATPNGHWMATTFVAGLRSTGIVAPLRSTGPLTQNLFRAYITQILAPALTPDVAGVMDNLSVHKVAGICKATEAVGADMLYLPP